MNARVVDPLNAPLPRTGAPPPVVEARNLGVTYGHGIHAVEAIRDISFSVRPGEFACIVGPSGCGKTTLLRSLSGLLKTTRGQVFMNGQQSKGVPDGLALVFQEYTRSLLPWQSVEKNVMLPLKPMGLSRTEREDRVRSALANVGLDGFNTKYPWQLSGGMQQRVAIARALAYRPSVLLMDEPFASVDAQVRADLEDLMLKVHAQTDITILLVTHDIDEAVYLGDTVIALSKRPTVVRECLTVDLPRPRDQVQTKALPEFIQTRTRVMEFIRKERTTMGTQA